MQRAVRFGLSLATTSSSRAISWEVCLIQLQNTTRAKVRLLTRGVDQTFVAPPMCGVVTVSDLRVAKEFCGKPTGFVSGGE